MTIDDEWESDDVGAVALAGTSPSSNGQHPEPPNPARFYPTLEMWVSKWFVHAFAAHPGPNRRWCSQWWDHPEAIYRLEDLWRSWETLRLNKNLGMSTWLREHLDPQRDRLMSDNGPFMSCDVGQHNPPEPLRVDPAPKGFWDLPGRKENQ